MMRVGLGYDIHRTAPGCRLVLGGVVIPADFGLLGHSDADVILHALMDALLGAAGLGDIGRHFPPADEAYRDASSLQLLHDVCGLVRRHGYTLVNADVVTVAERPRLAPFIDEMQRRIADVMAVDSDMISIKATTNEGVGPEGRGEAISARTVVLIERSG
jgi:2-C-methyl-D-erythritol 2,4-cyclodiphosphate synthase